MNRNSNYLRKASITCFSFLSFILPNVSLFAQSMQHSELLGRPSDNSISLQLIFNDTAEVRVQFGTSSGNYSRQTNWQTFLPNTSSEVVITNLLPDTKYFYRTNIRKAGSTSFIQRPEYTFQTQRTTGKQFTFIVQADPHLDAQSDTAVYNRCLQNQLEDNPDFMIDLGDFLMTDKLRNSSNQVPRDTVTYRCNLLRSYYEKITHSVPLFIALGNHEGEAGWYLNGTANSIPVWGTNDRKKYFLNPLPDNFYSGDTTHYNFVGQRAAYYSWTWGDALFIVLDPYWSTAVKPDSLNGWRWTLGKTQYDWLKTTLEKSTSKFKFVFAHQIIGGDPEGRGGVEVANLYEWGGNNLNGTPGFATNRPGWYKPIKDLLKENRVTIFFHGHDHFFGKQDKDCLVYQETPQPSHPNYTSASQAAAYGYFQGQILPNSGHLRITVNQNGVRVDYVRTYTAASENATRHNKDVSATYYIGAKNCYDSLSTGVPVLWNNRYMDELMYPNPFSKLVNLEFSLPAEDDITLSIYNAEGKLVRELLTNSTTPAGGFSIIWDGTDNAGKPLPDGMYFYSFKGTLTGEKSRKIVLKRE